MFPFLISIFVAMFEFCYSSSTMLGLVLLLDSDAPLSTRGQLTRLRAGLPASKYIKTNHAVMDYSIKFEHKELLTFCTGIAN